eukprot:tig00000367_g24486.t1
MEQLCFLGPAALPAAAGRASSTLPRAPPPRMLKAEWIKYDDSPPLGEGSYGTVRKALLADPEGGPRAVVVKETKEDERSVEYGEVEVYMNKKLCQECSEHMATFIGHFRRHIPHQAGADLPLGTAPSGQTVGLVWEQEATETLRDYIERPGGLAELEKLLLGPQVEEWSEEERLARLLKEVAQRLMAALAAFHELDIVHRDVKPGNVLVLPDSSFRFIDFGCSADMATYVGYDPKKMRPPRARPAPAPPPPAASYPGVGGHGPGAPAYRAPEEFVSTWFPDRFDTYNVGVVMLQLAFRHLRGEAALLALADELRAAGWDLDKWLQGQLLHGSAERLRAGLAVLNRDEAAAWDLLRRLITRYPRNRISAAAALAEHRYLRGGAKLGPFSFLGWGRK